MKFNQLAVVIFLLLGVSCTSNQNETTPSEVDLPPKLKYMSLDRAHNQGIFSDLSFNLSDDYAYAKVNRTTDRNNLTPSFQFDGKSVTVNGEEQISGSSSQDFTSTVTYTVKSDGYEDKMYNIDVIRFTNLPIIDINTKGNQPIDSKEDYVETTISVTYDLDKTYELSNIAGKIRGRGNSTWYFHEKKPYQLKFDEKTSMFGLPADKKWIFLAEHSDRTLLRNRLAFEMGRISHLPYTPKGEMAEVFINNVYAGTYHVCQKVEESSNRVDLKDKGFLMEIDQLDRIDDGDTFFSTDNYYINIKDPDVEYSSSEYSHVKGHINDFENALMGDDFLDEELGYKKYVDLNTFADWFLINEILRNPDARSWSSIYVTYIPGEKIVMGPLWDFDLSLGNAYYDNHYKHEGFWVRHNAWISRMLEDPEFSQLVRDRLDYFIEQKTALLSFIDTNAQNLRWAQQENDIKWNTIGNKDIWPSYYTFSTYQEEVDFMKSYFEDRLNWLDKNL